MGSQTAKGIEPRLLHAPRQIISSPKYFMLHLHNSHHIEDIYTMSNTIQYSIYFTQIFESDYITRFYHNTKLEWGEFFPKKTRNCHPDRGFYVLVPKHRYIMHLSNNHNDIHSQHDIIVAHTKYPKIRHFTLYTYYPSWFRIHFTHTRFEQN